MTQSALRATSKGNYVPQAGVSSAPTPHPGKNKNKSSQGSKHPLEEHALMEWCSPRARKLPGRPPRAGRKASSALLRGAEKERVLDDSRDSFSAWQRFLDLRA